MLKILELCKDKTQEVTGIDVTTLKNSEYVGSWSMIVDIRVSYIGVMNYFIDLEKNPNFITYISEYLSIHRASVYNYIEKYKQQYKLGKQVRVYIPKIVALVQKELSPSELISTKDLLIIRQQYLEDELAKVKQLLQAV